MKEYSLLCHSTDLNINLTQKYLCRHIHDNILIEYLGESIYHAELTIRATTNSGKYLASGPKNFMAVVSFLVGNNSLQFH